MLLPDIAQYSSSQYSATKTTKKIVEFKGINFSPVISNGEFEAMTNLSSRNYPCLSPRLPRSTYQTGLSGVTSMLAVGQSGKLAWVKTDHLYYDGADKGALANSCAGETRQMVEFQDGIIIWPDKMYYDITDNEIRSLALSESKTGLVFSASVADSSHAESVMFASIASTAAFSFAEGDRIEITGCVTKTANNTFVTIDHISSDNKTLYFAENVLVDGTESGSVTLSRNVPDLDYICVANNRVWGVKGSKISGSKAGSATNWNPDKSVGGAYEVDVASAGDFIGCHAYGNYVIFLKEDYIYKLIGTKPSNYQTGLITCPGLGLEKGSANSMAYIAGILYFKSRLGVVGFNGGTPWLTSAKLGSGKFSNAVAASDGRRYYISMTDGTAYSLFVYDSFYDVWHREDAQQAAAIDILNGHAYLLNSAGNILKLDDTSATESIEWSGTLGEFTEQSAEQKTISRLRMRVELTASSTMKVEYQADGGDWVTAWTGSGAQRGSFYISVSPTACYSFKVRISGTGDCKIYQMDRVFAPATDMG